jgi:hypothetical protein
MNEYLSQFIAANVKTILPINGIPRLVELAQLHLPYLLQPIGGNSYIVLNRHYKPLGVENGRQVDYYAPEFAHFVIHSETLNIDAFPDERRHRSGKLYFCGGIVSDAEDTASYKRLVAKVFGMGNAL